MVRFFLVTSMLLFMHSSVVGSERNKAEALVDLQDVLGPTVLSVPPHQGLQPLRVRQAGSKLGVDGQPILRTSAAKGLRLTISVTKFVEESVTLLVREGLFVTDQKGQTFVPLPARYALTEPVTTIHLRVVPTSPKHLLPTSEIRAGFVGQYNEVLGLCFRKLDKLLNVSMPKIVDRLEKVNGHWKFRDRAPDRTSAQWLRWLDIKERAGSVHRFDLPLNFWRYLVWSVLEGYNVDDFSGWLRATANLSEEYANIDALELTEGLAFFFRGLKLNADVIGPGTYQFYFNQGVRAFRASDYRGAEALFREALRFDGTQHDGHFNLGLCLYRLGDFDGAAQAWLVGTGLPGASADIFYHRGVALYRLESKTKAALMFRAALAKNSRHKRAAKWLKIVDPKNKTRPKKSRRKRWRRRR